MRASESDGETAKHLSGAERLVADEALSATVSQMISRATATDPDEVSLSLEKVPYGACLHVGCLPVHTVLASTEENARMFSSILLERVGVSPSAAFAAFSALRAGLGPEGKTLRGASLWDRISGERQEPDPNRGVRTSRFDYSFTGPGGIDDALFAAGLNHFRTREALAVATKTLWSGVQAELCWSDDPDYTAGYVATNRDGYVRIPKFKPAGARGGRIFFIDSKAADLDTLVHRLEREYVLIDPPFLIHNPVSTVEFLERI